MNILGKSVATAEQMANYLLKVNPEPQIDIPVLDFCRLFLYISAIEGVRGDILFAQSCKETGNYKFKGTVKPEQNNYAGIGTVDDGTKGAYFPDEATGILAQAQHAKAYATEENLNYECVDPRYHLVRKGSASTWGELAGKWAVPGYDTNKYSSLVMANEAKDSYGYQILEIYNKIIGENQEIEEIKPTVKKTVCIDAGHYEKYNRCPSIPSYYESEVMWKLHILQKKYLEERGIEVITTRELESRDLALQERGKKSKGCDLFISDHSNAVGNGMNESVDYVAIYHLADDTTTDVDDISKELAKQIAPVIANTMQTTQGYKVLQRKAQSDRNHDGLFNDNYYGVLHGARLVSTPALILEHSFHTNTRAVNWLLDDENLDRLAKAEADCIANFLISQGSKEEAVDFPYEVVVTVNTLNVRSGAGTKYKLNTTVHQGEKYTIVEEFNGWGRLKSGAGWIYLKHTKRS